MRVALLKVLLIVAIVTIPVCSRLLSNEDKVESDTGAGDDKKVEEPAVGEVPVGEKKAEDEAVNANSEANKVHAAIKTPVVIPATPVAVPSKSRAGLYILVAVALLGVVAIGTTFVLGKQKN